MSLSNDTHRCPGVSEEGEWREGCSDCLRRTERGGDPQWTMTPPLIVVFECHARIAPRGGQAMGKMMTDILSIHEVRGQLTGALIGFELTTHPGGEKLLVWADQRGMPGFRIGDAFVPGYGETLEIGKRITLGVDG